jgi:oxygen-independent coproporphyrinogen-3 oxidase
MQETIESLLAEHGYAHYETSAFARPDFQSRHNSNYWLFGDYLGIGAGAHSKISFADRIVRQIRWKHPREYLDRAADQPVQQENEVNPADLPFEFMMNALRLVHGFSARLFEERTGLPLIAVRRELDEAERLGLLTRSIEQIAPTLRGQRFLNDLLQLFLREP